MDRSVAFIGLGNLGLPMATNLADAGVLLRVYNRTESKSHSLVARGMDRFDRPVDAVEGGGVVVTVLWDDAALESVVESDGFLDKLGTGGVYVSMSTVSPDVARRLATRHQEMGSTYVAAPVFGRPEAAVARQLWIPIAGDASAKAQIRPLLAAMGAQGIFDFGEDAGAGTVVKLAGNFLIISAARSLGEALAMVRRNGVDPQAVVDMLTTTLFPAPIYRSYGKAIAEGTAPAMKSSIPTKDMGLFARAAEHVDSPMPISTAIREMLLR